MGWRFALLTILLPALSVAGAPAGEGTTSSSKQLHAIFDSCFDTFLEAHPVHASQLGDRRFARRLGTPLFTDAGRAAFGKVIARCVADVESVPVDSLEPGDLLSRELFLRDWRETIEMLAWPDHLLPVSQSLGSMPVVVSQMATGEGVHPFETAQDFEDFIARMAAFGDWVDVAIANMAAGIARGIVQPRRLSSGALRQLDRLIADDVSLRGALRHLSTAEVDGDGERMRIRKAYEEAVRRDLLPAFTRLRDYVRDVYVRKSRRTISWSALPDGKAWYAAQVRAYTSTNLTPEAIRRTGLREFKRLAREMDRLSREKGSRNAGTGDPIAAYKALAERVRPRLGELFGLLPTTSMDVRPVPNAVSTGAPGAYYIAAPVGSERPGVFYVNLRSRWGASEALFLHEGLPGHHFQISLAGGLTHLPRFRRFAYYGAYIEGWGLYAESLGVELGLYRDVAQQRGRLRLALLRAARLVMDTGIHHFGWSEKEAKDYSEKHLRGFGAYEINRYLSIPGQALTYKIGELRLHELRARAEKSLGKAFELKEFHDLVLGEGALPLDLLEARVDAWIAASRPSD